jgi:hypothetical protein
MNRALRTAMGWLAFSGLMPVAAQANDLVNIYDSPTLLTQATSDGQERPVVSEDIDPIGQAGEESSQIELTDAVEATPISDSTVKEYHSASYGKSLGCCDSGNCGKSCCPKPSCCCCDPCMPFVGVAATFLAPVHNRSSVGNVSVLDPGGATLSSLNSQTVGNMTVGPRIWAGIRGPAGWAGVVRYWRFVDDQGGFSPQAAPPFSLSQGHLQLQTFDAEAIRYFSTPNSNLWLSMGVRHAQFQQSGTAISSSVVNNGLVTSSAFSGASTYATGITNGLFGTCRIHNTNWSWFYGGRTSFLWDGNAKSAVTTAVSYTDPLVAAAAINGASFRNNGDLFIGEAQLGTQYNRQLVALPMNAFFRVAFEYQYWNLNMHGGAQSTSFAGNGANAIGVATARAGGSTLDLIGFNVATGFWW